MILRYRIWQPWDKRLRHLEERPLDHRRSLDAPGGDLEDERCDHRTQLARFESRLHTGRLDNLQPHLKLCYDA